MLATSQAVQHRARSEGAFLKGNVIILLLALCATAAGAWARQVKGGGDVEDVKTIDVIASRFQFEPATITVAQGDSVRLRLHSADRTHGFAIKAFRVKALIPKVGEAVTMEFVADQAGTFDFTCSEYCGTGHAAMKGRLVVLARGK
jgi:cytochrome c oxidase subunit 2